MTRLIAFVYGLIAYTLFFLACLYLIGFLANLWVPKGVDDGVTGSTAVALLVNLGLVALFGLQHSVMARPALSKRLIADAMSPRVWRRSIVPRRPGYIPP